VVVQPNNTAQSITAQEFEQNKESIGPRASHNKEYSCSKSSEEERVLGRDLIESRAQIQISTEETPQIKSMAQMLTENNGNSRPPETRAN
jgi:hypothetical protein